MLKTKNPKSKKGKGRNRNAQTVTLTVHSQLLASNEIDRNYIQVNIAPQIAAFSQAVSFSKFYQEYTVEKVKWKVLNEKPVNVLLAKGAHYSVPRYYKVDLVNDQLPDAKVQDYLKYQKVSTGLMSGVLTGQFIPYSSVVGDSDRAFKQRQKVTTKNLDLFNYGCSLFFVKNVVPATDQLFALTVIVSATIRFHHFDGVAVLAKLKSPVLQKALRMKQKQQDSQSDQEFAALNDASKEKSFKRDHLTLKQIQALLLRGGVQQNPGPFKLIQSRVHDAGTSSGVGVVGQLEESA